MDGRMVGWLVGLGWTDIYVWEGVRGWMDVWMSGWVDGQMSGFTPHSSALSTPAVMVGRCTQPMPCPHTPAPPPSFSQIPCSAGGGAGGQGGVRVVPRVARQVQHWQRPAACRYDYKKSRM